MKPKTNKSNERKTDFFKCLVKRDLLAYKGFSFFLYGAFGSFYPYLPLYFKQYGLTSFQAGTIVGIRPLIQLVGAPFCTAIGERFKAEKIVLMCGILAWLIKALIILFVVPHKQLCVEKYINSSSNVTSVYTKDLWTPDRENHEWTLVISLKEPKVVPKNKLVLVEQHDVKNNGNTSNIVIISKKQQETVLSSTTKKHTEVIEKRSKKKASYLPQTIMNIQKHFDHSLNQTISFITEVDTDEILYMFWIFLMVIVIGEFLESPTYALSDASLLSRLAEERSYYGQVRLWGAIGWAISTALVGYLIFETSYVLCGLLKPDYDFIFYVYFGFVSCAFICSNWFSFQKREEEQDSSFKKVVKELCYSNHLIFMTAILFTGCCYGLLFHFVNWYIDDKRGSSLVMGAAGAARELGEMTSFFLGGTCLRFLGNLNMMAICLLSYAACFYWYSIIETPWLAVPLEALDGSIYGLVWCNSIDYMSAIGAPIGAVVPMQGILQGIFYGLGNGGGTVLSGHLYHNIGAKRTFQYFAIASLVVLLYLLVAFPVADGCVAREQEQGTGIDAKYEPVAIEPSDDEPSIGTSSEAGNKDPLEESH